MESLWILIATIRLQYCQHLNNINRGSGIEIPEASIPTIKQHNSQSMRTYEGTSSNDRNNNEHRNAPIAANQRAKNSDT